MYYCTTCGAVFDEPGVEYQMHAFGDGYASEPRSCCPKCGGDYEEIVGECQNCEKVISTEAAQYYHKRTCFSVPLSARWNTTVLRRCANG